MQARSQQSRGDKTSPIVVEGREKEGRMGKGRGKKLSKCFFPHQQLASKAMREERKEEATFRSFCPFLSPVESEKRRSREQRKEKKKK